MRRKLRPSIPGTKILVGLVVLFTLAAYATLAARLPAVGGDKDVWGDVLNEFLNVTLTQNGTLRNDIVNNQNLNASSVTAEKIAAQSINSTHLSQNSVNSTHISNGSINTAEKIADDVVTGAKISANAINSSHIIDSSISGNDINSTANVTVNMINASAFAIGTEIKTATCNTVSCIANASCPVGKKILFGFSADNSVICNNAPLNCNGYCTAGLQHCDKQALVSSASVFVICAKIA